MDSICIDCRNSEDCKHKPTANQWIVAGCPSFVGDTVITNADRIRQMSDEELAKLFVSDWYDGVLFSCPVEDVECGSNVSCDVCFREWLKSPVEEVDK